MKKTTFIADGKTKAFHFAFPFFFKSDIVIEVDSVPATKYYLVCTSNGPNADVPFSGGQVCFNAPPKLGSTITITRKLAIKRIVDYQPTARYSAIAHNHDMNYMIEILKDMQLALDSFAEQYATITGTDSIDTISQKIEQIITAINDLQNTPNQPGTTVDLSEINASIESLSTSINSLTTRCNQMSAQIADIGSNSMPDDVDYIVASQMPTAENNYTWYRKYASGWVEQGGICPSLGYTVVFPVAMADTRYTAQGTARETSGNYAVRIQNITTTSFKMNSSSANNHEIWWSISGIAANDDV